MKRLYLSKMKNLLLLVMGLFISGSLVSQTVTGTVVDGDTGEALIGASVFVKGSTDRGTITDIDGTYSLQASASEILVFSFVGYNETEEVVGNRTVIDVAMSQGVLVSEVVVTGYSTDTRRNTPGSVSTIKAAALKAVPSGNVEQQLQGRVPGVTVISNGQPGTTSQVRVRGYGALGGNAPLYVIDGVPVGSTDFLSPDDIESTTVLKDATSASIYGARAAGGVIVYTTKKGKRGDGKVKVTYDGVVGVTTPGSGPDILNPQEQADYTWLALQNAGQTPSHPQYGSGATPVLPDYLLVGGQAGVSGPLNLSDYEDDYNVDPNAGSVFQVVRANKEGTDWYDALTRNALLNRHALGFSGGSDNGRFYAGIAFQEQDGIIQHQKLRRYTARFNSEFDLTDWLRVGENIQATRRETRLLFGDGGGQGSSDDENIINLAYRLAPIIPVYDEFGGYAGTGAPGFNNPSNVIADTDGQQNNRGSSNEAFGNVYVELEPVEDLVLRSSFGGRYQFVNFFNYNRRTYENAENNSSFGFGQGSSQFSSWTFTNTAAYNKTIDLHEFSLLAGQESLNIGSFRGINASGINPFSQSPDFVSINTVNDQVVFGNHSNGINFLSYFGSLKYTYNDKYILSAIVRRDGSSRFGAENRYGTFPAFSVAWRLSSEPFMQNMPWIDDLKIRAGYGIMGNSNNVDPNNQFSLFGTSLGASTYDISGTNSSASQGFFRTRIGNPFAKWEKAITYNVGVDALLNNGKWDIGIELWQKDTEDLLFQQPITVQTGPNASPPSVNIGKMRNRGIDLSVTNKGILGQVGYEVTVNGGFLNNEIVELAEGINDLPNRSSAYRGVVPVLNQVGEPLSSFYGYNVLGLFASDADVEGHATQADAAPGRLKFEDVNGDGVINTADRVTIGNPIPDFTGGLTIKLDYKGFDLELYSFASVGNEIFNIQRLFTDFYSLFPGAAISGRVRDSWTPQNLDAEIPIFENASNFSTNTQSSSFFVEDGSYFRIQNLTIGYNLPTGFLDNTGLQRMRAFVGMNNLLTITGYSGLDPSVGGLADTNFGVDVGNFPITRSYTVGLNVGF